MTTLKFKTNINCASCVAKVTPFLDNEKSIGSWEVDTANKEKILTVSGVEIDRDKVLKAVEKSGFVVKGEIE